MLPIKHDQRHIKQASHNASLLKEACFPDPCITAKVKYKDWTATVAFYIALHHISAYLHQNSYKAEFKSHRERNDYLKTIASLKDRKIRKILGRYLTLYKFCRRVRYSPCQYGYVRLNDLCKHVQFALKDLPKELNVR
jgi:hypothetical protein